MKKREVLLPFLAFMLVGNIQAQQQKVSFANTIEIKATDTPEMIIEKAAHIVPTPNQLAALQNEFIAFIHFGPNTFTRKEWGDGMEDPKIFDLKNLDTDQWCQAIKAAGMKMVLLTVKHHDGFVLWQSRYTKHGIMSTDFMDGKGDILKSLSASCQKYGIKLGVYLSPADLYQIENPQGLYGNLSKYTKRTIPHPVEGRPFANQSKFEFVVDDYNEYFLNQLFELLTEYGRIDEVWFDGAHPKSKGGQTYNYPAWKQLIKTLAPQAVIFGREDIRWCGNESGGTRSTEWNVIPFTQNPDTTSYFPDMTDNDLGSRERLYKAKFLHYQQAETNTSIREGWFYRDDTRQKVRSTDDVFDIYERSVGGNSTFLLNIPPNRDGRFSDADVKTLTETGKRINDTYSKNLLQGAQAPAEILDNNGDTYINVDKPITITLASPVTFNRLMLQEAVGKCGERVERHVVDALVDGAWKEIAGATNIGYKRILRFPDVTTNKIRIRILESRLCPTISEIAVHHYQSRPPQLSYRKDVNGMVTIEPLKADFGWKAHGEDIAKNLNSGFEIYYTTDGTEPTKNSTHYTAPFKMGKGTLKAVSILNQERGAVMTEQLGLNQNGWKLLEVSGDIPKYEAAKAFDANPHTYWLDKNPQPHFISLDLGQIESLNGFAYTPQKQHSEGMMAKGDILISEDGKNWTKIESFDFGNLINDPTKRLHYFKTAVKTRYIRINTTEIAQNSKIVSVAEIDLF